MDAMTYTTVRANLASTMDRVCNDHEAVIITRIRYRAAQAVPRPWDESQVENADEQVVISHNWDELRRFMWDYVGIVRTTKRLERAAHRITLLQREIQEFYAQFHVTRNLLELRNLVQVADLIVRSASPVARTFAKQPRPTAVAAPSGAAAAASPLRPPQQQQQQLQHPHWQTGPAGPDCRWSVRP